MKKAFIVDSAHNYYTPPKSGGSSKSSFGAEDPVQYVHMPRERLLDELSSCLSGCPVTAGIKIAPDVQGGKVSNRDGS